MATVDDFVNANPQYDPYMKDISPSSPITLGKFALTHERKVALMITVGAAAGVAQTIILKKFIDGNAPTWFPTITQIGSFGKPSALMGIAGGVIGILAGLYVPLDPKFKNIAIAYGGSALASGILSGLDLMG